MKIQQINNTNFRAKLTPKFPMEANWLRSFESRTGNYRNYRLAQYKEIGNSGKDSFVLWLDKPIASGQGTISTEIARGSYGFTEKDSRNMDKVIDRYVEIFYSLLEKTRS